MSDLADPSPATDFAASRENMVNGQITPARVSDPRIIAALRRLPRELFVPAGLRDIAYIDKDLPLGGGRILMEPRVLARLVQIAQPRKGETALVIGAGTGYGAAVLASLNLDVTAIEEDAALLEIARAAAARSSVRIAFHQGKLADGLAGHQPFDLVLIEGAVETIPVPIVSLVAPGGRLVTVLVEPGEPGRGVVAERSGDTLRARPHFDAGTALLPGFAREATFRF